MLPTNLTPTPAFAAMRETGKRERRPTIDTSGRMSENTYSFTTGKSIAVPATSLT